MNTFQIIAGGLSFLFLVNMVVVIVRDTRKAREDLPDQLTDADCFPAPFTSAKWGRR